MASPIGIVLALAAAIALLWDDYQTWKRRGESLLDWEKWASGIETAISKIKELGNTLKDLQQKATDFILGKKIGDETLGIKLGRTVAKGLAFIGNKEAQTALDAEKASTGNTKQQSTQTLQQTALVGVNRIVGMANVVAEDVNAKTTANQSWSPSINSKNFTPEKAIAIADVAKRIGVDPNDLAAVISFETSGTFSPSIKNKKSSATGLIQFMKGSGGTKGKYYGMSRDSFASLSFTEQMKYVERYFRERGFDGKKMRDVADTYTAVTGYGYKKGTPTYDLNPVWDSNHNDIIEKGEMVLNPSFRAHQKTYFKKPITSVPTDMKEKISKMAQNAEVPNNIKSVVPNFSNSQSFNRNVNINQKTDIHVTGGDAMMTAKAIRKEQDAVNLQMTRNSKGLMVWLINTHRCIRFCELFAIFRVFVILN
ncbi:MULTISPECIES: hypothetical protein [Acinetobacter]|nr:MULTISPECIES: hypothetical protein [Acinetobacter]MCS4297678.1 hypothetical protein [Acinetobacter guillouiae]MCW2249642.1 hypothetical protein [Acinetobacter sp. BIGb0204]NII38746.1 hypothetical protein [Acinetobacter sp. BIGb0196]